MLDYKFGLTTRITYFSGIIYESVLGERPQDTCQEAITMSTKPTKQPTTGELSGSESLPLR